MYPRRPCSAASDVTGANNYTTGTGEHSPIEPDAIRKTPYFYLDGGGMKLCADACPTIERVEAVGNYTSPCGAGVSVEHLGKPLDAPFFRDCIFRYNRTLVTSAALNLLHGSRATLENCLLVGNMANLGLDYVGLLTGGEYHPEHRSGAITVFEGARAEVRRCIFTVNWAGVDDNGTASTYVKSFSGTTRCKGGVSTGARYEIDIAKGAGVKESFINGETNDLRGTIDRATNTVGPPDPRFDAQFVPEAPEYRTVGYLPTNTASRSPPADSRMVPPDEIRGYDVGETTHWAGVTAQLKIRAATAAPAPMVRMPACDARTQYSPGSGGEDGTTL